jgi:CheY-like chemotaxis protein
MSRYRNILLVEDDLDDRDFFLEVLSGIDSKINCTHAKDGAQGLELLATLPLIEILVFLDLNLPKMSGLEVLDKIRKTSKYKDVPVIVLTTSKSDAKACTDRGANLYIIKPSSEDLLHNVLSIILQHDVMKDCDKLRNLLEAEVSHH